MSIPIPPDKIFSVSEISRIVKEMLEGTFPPISVKGEVSNLKIASSGHIYFDLKDENALIPAVFFKGYARNFNKEIRNGLMVTVRATLSCYIKQGRYQLIVVDVSPDTAGDLFLAFERLKQKLTVEGLFDAERKKPIPEYPAKIGIVTSPTGAAIRDILSILKRRGSGLHIVVAPVAVQGESAKHEIAQAIEDLNALPKPPDLLLVGRGGGSIEDLWAFNEEIVARAIAASKIPVISCVGHETDFTIADFVADLRAPTPSAAAELAVKNRADTLSRVENVMRRLVHAISLAFERASYRLTRAAQSAALARPETLWQQKSLALDDLSARAERAAQERLTRAEHRLSVCTGRLTALNPSAVLSRGYSIVRDIYTGKVIASAAQCAAGEDVEIKFKDGRALGRLTETHTEKQ